MLRRTLALVTFALAASAAPTRAQFPGLTLTFTDRTGVVGPNDPIEIWVRLALDANAPGPLTFLGGFGEVAPFGLPPAFVPTEGYYHTAPNLTGPFAEIGDAFVGLGYICAGDTFYGVCSGGPYDFMWWTDRTDPTRPVVPGPYDVTLLPGQSVDYLFGTYTPRAGGAPPGTYYFPGAPFQLGFIGEDAAGERLNAFVTLARTCPTNDSACTFTRTVLATPEPASVALLAGGLVALAVTVRRRRTG